MTSCLIISYYLQYLFTFNNLTDVNINFYIIFNIHLKVFMYIIFFVNYESILFILFILFFVY
jgi:hypothetical protein